MTPWTVAYQAPLSMGFPRQEYWSGLLFSVKFKVLLHIPFQMCPEVPWCRNHTIQSGVGGSGF